MNLSLCPSSEEVQIRNSSDASAWVACSGWADGERLELPPVVFRLLKEIVRNMQLGRAIVLIPENQQLTTQRAADLLGVSGPISSSFWKPASCPS